MGYRMWHLMVFQLTLCRHWIIFVSAGGEPQMCSVLHVLCACIPAACTKACAQLTRKASQEFMHSDTNLHVNISDFFFSLFAYGGGANSSLFFCSVEIQQSTKWNSLLVKTTYTSCRLLHRSARVATVTLCLRAAAAGLHRTSGGPSPALHFHGRRWPLGNIAKLLVHRTGTGHEQFSK